MSLTLFDLFPFLSYMSWFVCLCKLLGAFINVWLPAPFLLRRFSFFGNWTFPTHFLISISLLSNYSPLHFISPALNNPFLGAVLMSSLACAFFEWISSLCFPSDLPFYPAVIRERSLKSFFFASNPCEFPVVFRMNFLPQQVSPPVLSHCLFSFGGHCPLSPEGIMFS